MRISDWSSDVCSSDLHGEFRTVDLDDEDAMAAASGFRDDERVVVFYEGQAYEFERSARGSVLGHGAADGAIVAPMPGKRSEERRVGKGWVSTCRSRLSP